MNSCHTCEAGRDGFSRYDLAKPGSDHLIGEPLIVLRNEIMDRLGQVSENLAATGLVINEIVLKRRLMLIPVFRNILDWRPNHL
jgi:hypothetical protein